MGAHLTNSYAAKLSIGPEGSQLDTHSAEVIERWLVDKLSNLLGVEPPRD